MIAAAFLMLAVHAAPPVDQAGDVVVIGQRLQQQFKAGVRFDKSGARCKVDRSTGDAEIDRVGCAALEVCFPQFRSRYDATSDRAIRPEVRKVMRSALNQELASCVTREQGTGIATLAARRGRARSGR